VAKRSKEINFWHSGVWWRAFRLRRRTPRRAFVIAVEPIDGNHGVRGSSDIASGGHVEELYVVYELLDVDYDGFGGAA
jgi:hypothetical protein